jgi:phospholipid/cholesterol/gamma-HCH transport system permease protein
VDAPGQDDDPSYARSGSEHHASLVLVGDWTASKTARMEALVEGAADFVSTRTIDVGAVGRMDTFGAWAIESIRRREFAGTGVIVIGADAERAKLLAQIEPFCFELKNRNKRRVSDGLAELGRGVTVLLSYILSAMSMLGRVVVLFAREIPSPKSLRVKSVIHHLDRVGVQAAPIIVLMTFLVGAIIAQQGLFYFRKFGATDYVVNFVTVLVLRELGVLLVVIMIAGRSGSSFAAEIGSMKMREEVDALRTMGLDPAALLVVPRMAALVLGAPMLTILGILSALFGAGLVMWLYSGMAPIAYLTRVKEAATYTDFAIGMIKAPLMALVIGVVAAVEGFDVQGSAESLGLRTTASVVKSIFLVIVLDGICSVVFTSLGI